MRGDISVTDVDMVHSGWKNTVFSSCGHAAAGRVLQPIAKDDPAVSSCHDLPLQGLCSAFYNLLMVHLLLSDTASQQEQSIFINH